MLVLWQCLRPLFDFADRNRNITPDIDADIDRISASHPLIMHMAKQMERTFSGPVPSDHWVMIEDRMGACPVGDFGHLGHACPRELLRGLAIMIADNQMLLFAGQAGEQVGEPFAILRLGAKREVADDPKRILRPDLCTQIGEQHRIHVASGLKRSPAMLDDVVVTEMRVGRVPDGHSAVFGFI